MIKVRVDFNARGRGGLVKTSLQRIGPVHVGDRVLACDPAEDLEFEAEVREVDEATGKVYLEVLWRDAADAVFMSHARVWMEPSEFLSEVAAYTAAAFDPGSAPQIHPTRSRELEHR